jgi:hypothetical protein
MASQEKPRRPKKSDVQLMFNSHDPLAERQRADRAQENDYFRKLDQELIAALRDKSAAEIEQVIRQYTRMRCPKCGEPLEERLARQATIDACPGCGGIWLEKGAWEVFVGPQEHGWLQRLFAGLTASKQ